MKRGFNISCSREKQKNVYKRFQKPHIKIVFVFCLFFLVSNLSYSFQRNIELFLEKIENAQSFSFRFEQIYISYEDQDRLEEEGTTFFSNEKWRWDYRGLENRSYIIKNNNVYEITDNGVEQLDIEKEKFNQSIVNILREPSKFFNDRRYIEKDNILIVKGEKKDNFKNVEVVFKENELEKVIIEAKNSDIIKFYIEDISFNIKIEESIFELPDKTKR